MEESVIANLSKSLVSEEELRTEINSVCSLAWLKVIANFVYVKSSARTFSPNLKDKEAQNVKVCAICLLLYICVLLSKAY